MLRHHRDRLPEVPTLLVLPSVARRRSCVAKGCWPFPSCSLTFWASEHDRARHRSTICIALRLAGRFDLSLPRRHVPFRSVRPLRTPFPVHLGRELHSWGSSKIPFHRHHLGSPLLDEPSLILRRAAYQAARSFRPCRSTRLRRFTPPKASQVCCTLQPILGFAVFQSSRVRLKVIRDGRGISSTARALRSFSLANSSDASPRPLALPPSYSTYVPPPPFDGAGRHVDHSTSGLCSSCEAAANAPPLPVECCPLLPWASRSRVCLVRPVTRQSYGHSVVGKPTAGGLLVHPGRTQGQQPPSPMVLIGSAEQSRRAARPEERRSQRRPTRACASATRFVLVGGDARGVLLACRRINVRRRWPRPPYGGFSARNTQAIHTKSTALGCPRHRIFCKASLASLRATARLTSRSNQ